jgi:hypothetical protein
MHTASLRGIAKAREPEASNNVLRQCQESNEQIAWEGKDSEEAEPIIYELSHQSRFLKRKQRVAPSQRHCVPKICLDGSPEAVTKPS